MDDHGRDLPGSKQLCKRVSIKLAESCVASTLLCAGTAIPSVDY